NPAAAGGRKLLTFNQGRSRSLRSLPRAQPKARDDTTWIDKPIRPTDRNRTPNPGTTKPAHASLPRPEIRQPVADPPRLLRRVVRPLLGVAHRPLGHGVAVEDADLDLPQRLAFSRAGRVVAVLRHLHLLVALELQVAHRMRLAVLGIDQVPRALEI